VAILTYQTETRDSQSISHIGSIKGKSTIFNTALQHTLMLTKTGQEDWTAPHGICISTTHDHSLFSSLASSHPSLCLYSVAHYLTHPPTGLSNSISGKEQWVLYYTQRPRVLINSLVLFIINPIPPPKYHTSDTRFMYILIASRIRQEILWHVLVITPICSVAFSCK